jgi:hypothetical protein
MSLANGLVLTEHQVTPAFMVMFVHMFCSECAVPQSHACHVLLLHEGITAIIAMSHFCDKLLQRPSVLRGGASLSPIRQVLACCHRRGTGYIIYRRCAAVVPKVAVHPRHAHAHGTVAQRIHCRHSAGKTCGSVRRWSACLRLCLAAGQRSLIAVALSHSSVLAARLKHGPEQPVQRHAGTNNSVLLSTA